MPAIQYLGIIQGLVKDISQKVNFVANNEGQSKTSLGIASKYAKVFDDQGNLKKHSKTGAQRFCRSQYHAFTQYSSSSQG